MARLHGRTTQTDADRILSAKKTAMSVTATRYHKLLRSRRQLRSGRNPTSRCLPGMAPEKPIVVVDVETTGVDPNTDTVIQIAACKLNSRAPQHSAFMTYVRPESPISPAAQAIHGLTERHLDSAPSITEAIRKFNEYVQPGALLCGHNIAFDAAFIRASYAAAGIDYPFDYHLLDVWSVAFFLLESQGIKLRPLDLSALCEFYGISRGDTHDALEDALATAAILRRFYASVSNRHIDVTHAI